MPRSELTDSLDKTESARNGVSRRSVLAVGATGVSVVALAACSQAPDPNKASGASTSSSGTGAGASSGTSTSSAATGSGSSSAVGATSSGTVIAALSSVTVGSSISAKDKGDDILITRTAADTVVAFSAVCPHQGCTVASSFACPCHGSTFDPKTGAHISGPAPTGLKTVAVAVSGDNIIAT
jgi:Rieske Fe-S protein